MLRESVRRIRRSQYSFEALEPRQYLSAHLAADLNPTDQNSAPARFVDLNGTALFWANYGSLYRSDGTEGGTVQIHSVIQTAQANGGVPMTVVGSVAYFVAAETSGAPLYLWRTDGTSGGTEKIVQMPAGTPGPLAACNGTLYFGTTGQLWKSDGSAAGTVLVHTFSRGVPSGMTFYNGKVYLSADGELWATDGTDAGTQQVKDIDPSGDSAPTNLTVANGLLYFVAATSTTGREPWRTDGTSAGTILLSNIASGNTSSWPEGFIGLSAGTVFIAQGYLYITDGTTTNRLYGAFGDAGYSFTSLVRAGNYAFASAYDSVNGNHLWRTDGTHDGTMPIESFNGDDSWPLNLVAQGSKLFFTALGTGTGRDIYQSDGTVAGTVLVKDLPTTQIDALTPVGNRIFYWATDPIAGSEPFITDGTSAGTHLLKNLNTAPNSSNPGGCAQLRRRLLRVGHELLVAHRCKQHNILPDDRERGAERLQSDSSVWNDLARRGLLFRQRHSRTLSAGLQFCDAAFDCGARRLRPTIHAFQRQALFLRQG